jgi:hypothetical protein
MPCGTFIDRNNHPGAEFAGPVPSVLPRIPDVAASGHLGQCDPRRGVPK